MLITEDADDPRFNAPFVDVDEQRTNPVPHRYIHGGFTGTDARFSFYFPAADRYEGRFFQPTHQLFFSEDAQDPAVTFTIESGAYLVQSNMGGSEYPAARSSPFRASTTRRPGATASTRRPQSSRGSRRSSCTGSIDRSATSTGRVAARSRPSRRRKRPRASGTVSCRRSWGHRTRSPASSRCESTRFASSRQGQVRGR